MGLISIKKDVCPVPLKHTRERGREREKENVYKRTTYNGRSHPRVYFSYTHQGGGGERI